MWTPEGDPAITAAMQSELPLRLPAQPGGSAWPRAAEDRVPVRFVANRRARRYILRLTRDGIARVTIPRGGTTAEAIKFLERNKAWLERQWVRHRSQPRLDTRWVAGTE